MKILGIDPGSTRIGYGLIESSGDAKALEFGLIEISKQSKEGKIRELHDRFKMLLKKTTPELVAIEELFFSKNQKTAIEVAEARGIMKLLVIQASIPLLEYGPREVKIAITNDGVADKKAVIMMVERILKIKIKGPDDVADALAIALTAAARYRIDQLQKH